MSSQLQQQTVKSVVDQYSRQYGLPEHKAFLFFIIEKFLHHLDLNSIDVEDAIVDDSYDCGIDAIVIDEDSESTPRVYFFQSKYGLTERAFAKTFEGTALEKMQQAIDDFVLKGLINEKYQNERLVDKLHAIRNIKDKSPKYTVVFCSNTGGAAEIAKSRLEEFIQNTNKDAAGEYLSVEYVHLDRITKELVAPQQDRKLEEIQLQVEQGCFKEDTGDARLYAGATTAKALVDLVEKYGEDLFQRNVRGYLKQSNPINKGIIHSASTDASPYFIYMNNGVTITCEKYEHSPGSLNLKIKSGQIVNGQQTVRSLHLAYKQGKLRDDVKVLVRVVETDDPELLMQIVTATNSQTKVTSRDLHSNDEIQKIIEANLLSKGYYYESRKNKYQGKDGAKRIDAEVSAQAYYAIFFEQPALAKDKKKLLFGDRYDEIFDAEKLDPENILNGFRLIQKVQALNNQEEFQSYTFLKDATLHTAALIYRLMSVDGGALSQESIDSCEKYYSKALGALAVVVDERIQSEGDKYEHRRTFKDPETYGRAVEVLADSL